ncbi:MAG: hypothetical protein OWQ48_03425 [Desulfurococcus sp.]|nr:hypothetical protein [Desulfurococcus sp.]
MKPRWSRGSLVALTVLAALVFIGLVAMVEKGPVVAGIPQGASPLNPLSYGTLKLVNALELEYSVRVISSLNDLENAGGEKCVYATISPEVPFTLEEAEHTIGILKSKCGSLTVLVADESTYSNPLLIALNTSLRVAGDRVYVEHCVDGRCGYTPYPQATIAVGEQYFNLTLDLASSVTGRGLVRGCVNYPYAIAIPGYGVIASNTSECAISDKPTTVVTGDPVVAMEDSSTGIHVYVIGDGSIFLNQVLSSENATVYREFSLELFRYLCGSSPRCLILLDNTHYKMVNALDLLADPGRLASLGASLADMLYATLLILSVLLHPAFWMPLLFSYADDALRYILLNPLLAIPISVLAALIIDRLLVKDTRFLRRDERIEEQVERDITVFESTRAKIAEGREKLSKADFLNVYWLADQVSASLLGVQLSNPVFIEKASEYIGRSEAESYWSYMNKLYRKATGSSRRPILVRWHSETIKAYEKTSWLIRELASRLQIEDYRRLIAGG